MSKVELFIWVHRWEDFQHYKPKRDVAPAWIKSYTRQLDDDRYLELSLAQRGLLESLRLAFARASGRLPVDTRSLSRRIGEQVRRGQLESLNHAGLISFLSREALEERLETFYASRAPARSSEVEVEEEKERSLRASERELQDAHRSPAEEHAEDPDPEPAVVDLDPEPRPADGPMAEDVRSVLGALRPRGATA